MTGTTGPRVVVVSDEALVAETVSAALVPRGFHPCDESCGTAVAGLLISSLTSYRSVGAAREMVGRIDRPWLVVCGAPRGPLWGAMLEFGAVRVVGHATSVDEIAALLEAVIGGTAVADPVLDLDLRHQWRDFEQERRLVASRLATLSSWELTVLRSLYVGRSPAEVAAEHGLAEALVRDQVEALLAKVDLGSQLAAVDRLGELLLLGASVDPAP